MKSKFLYIIVILCHVIIHPLFAQSEHQLLFEKAQFAMDTKGDLKGAIELFEEFIQKFPDNTLLSAKSQYYIGQCYQKMGLKDAEIAYNKVINHYPSEIEIVKLARQKLSEIQIANKEVKIEREDFELTQVWDNPLDDMGMPSPDSKSVSFVNWNIPCLGIYNILTGEIKNITSTTGTWSSKAIWPESSIWSPDGKKLAYVWYDEVGVSIRMVGTDSSEPELLLADSIAQYSQPYSWSSDGQFILAVLCHRESGHEIVIVSTKDRSVKSMKKLKGSHPLVSLSPDNKYIAYSYTPNLNSPKTDIFLLNIKEGIEKIIVDHPETDFNPLWMPDGENMIFFSDRTGNVSVWVQKISDGEKDGKERFIKNLGRLDPKAITENGDLFMTFHEGGNDVYNAIIDPVRGKLISEPERVVETNIGWNKAANFSPDGKSMAYVSFRGVLNPNLSWGQTSLIIRDLETGNEQELIPRLKSIQDGPLTPIQWSPNGDEIMGTGRNDMGHKGAFIINLKDTSYQSLLEGEPFVGGNVIWSKSNKTLYYRIYGIPEKNGLYEIDRATNEQKRILKEDNIQQLAINPDGYLFALVVGKTIKLFDRDKNNLEEFIQFPDEFKHTTIAWSPDGKWLYYANCFGQNKVEFWRKDKDSGIEQLIANNFPHVKQLTMHPDGKRIAFTVGEMSGKSSLWVMRNYISK